MLFDALAKVSTASIKTEDRDRVRSMTFNSTILVLAVERGLDAESDVMCRSLLYNLHLLLSSREYIDFGRHMLRVDRGMRNKMNRAHDFIPRMLRSCLQEESSKSVYTRRT